MQVTELIEYLKSMPVDGEVCVKITRGQYDYLYAVNRIDNYHMNAEWHFKQRVVLVLETAKPVN